MQLAASNDSQRCYGILPKSDEQMQLQAKIGDTVYDRGKKWVCRLVPGSDYRSLTLTLGTLEEQMSKRGKCMEITGKHTHMLSVQ